MDSGNSALKKIVWNIQLNHFFGRNRIFRKKQVALHRCCPGLRYRTTFVLLLSLDHRRQRNTVKTGAIGSATSDFCPAHSIRRSGASQTPNCCGSEAPRYHMINPSSVFTAAGQITVVSSKLPVKPQSITALSVPEPGRFVQLIP